MISMCFRIGCWDDMPCAVQNIDSLVSSYIQPYTRQTSETKHKSLKHMNIYCGWQELEVKMWVSADRGQSFKSAHFPYQLSERSYRVVDSKENSVFVQVAS
jgi:hypothetical protein